MHECCIYVHYSEPATELSEHKSPSLSGVEQEVATEHALEPQNEALEAAKQSEEMQEHQIQDNAMEGENIAERNEKGNLGDTLEILSSQLMKLGA